MTLVTPDSMIEGLRAQGVEVSEEQASLAKAAWVYRKGDIHVLHAAQTIAIRPYGCRVLLRAILPEDASFTGVGVPYDSRQAVAHEVIDIGGGVERWLDDAGVPDDARDKRSLRRRLHTWLTGRGVRERSRPRAGDHLFLLSTAADRASKTDKTCRLWFCHVEDLSGGWEIPAVSEIDLVSLEDGDPGLALSDGDTDGIDTSAHNGDGGANIDAAGRGGQADTIAGDEGDRRAEG